MFLKIITLLIFLPILLLISCKKQQAGASRPPAPSMQTDTLFAAPRLERQYLEHIWRAQQKIVARPTEKSVRAAFLKIAYLPMRHMLITVGMARQTAAGKTAPRGLVKRAAVLDAKRWAAYGKSWLIYHNEPDFGKLNIFYKGFSKTMPSFTRHDSLFIPIVLRIY